MSTKWAIAQVNAGTSIRENLSKAQEMIQEASNDHCKLIAFPEFFLLRGHPSTILEGQIEKSGDVISRLRNSARKNDIYVLAGSLPTPSNDDDHCYNESILISSDGEIDSTYRKIHLFELDLEDEFSVAESDYQKSGNEITTADIDGLEAGLSICYDLRFPELYRHYAMNGVQVVFVPSNFTRETGRAHWEPLLRARAIENQVYVVAPNQIGANPETDVPSLGQSMVVDPWGQVIARASDRETWLPFTISSQYISEVREDLPCLDHGQLMESSNEDL